MFFIAIPLLLETILTVAAGTIAAKAASNICAHVTAPKDEHNDPEQTSRN